MSGARRRALLLIIVAAIPVIAAAQLNPTVKVLPRPKSAVPAECDQGLAIQPAQRLTPEERTSVRDTSRDMQAPPSASLRGEVQTAFEAAQRNSRDMFRDALVRAKSLLPSYPPGGERTAATNVVDVLDDIGKIWDYEFSSPTGAFFDTTSEPFRIASKYPGYESSIRRQIITDQNGNKFYPTHETRDFLVAEAAQRLSRLTGKPAPAPAVSSRRPTTVSRPEPRTSATTTTIAPSVESPKSKPQVTKRATTQTTKHTRRRTSHRAAPKPVTREARAKTETKHTAPPPRSTPREHTPAPVRAISSTTPGTETIAVGGVEPSTTSSASSATPGTTSSVAIASSDTATTTPATTMSAAAPGETTGTTTTESNTSEKTTKSRSLLWPILLIIVGVGLLLTLWRASS